MLTVLYALCLFLSAGSFAWPAAWFFLTVNLACQAGIGLTLRSTPGLLEKRMHSNRSTTLSWQIAGGALVLAGSLLAVWALLSNRHFYGFVRIGVEGHTVFRSGPYAAMRHPGYTGGLVFNPGIPLLLSSGWAYIPAGITILALGSRTMLEDRFLRQNLPGYEEYASIVRWRLLPGVW
ncbi:MAG: isoprenylcysteine carboxylmethyltransferase family protein [Anaerolineales bacterium]|nr:isoprenylcysteine carboxylmethyltransferase family protein [Anaerolineales bacterium]